MNGYYWQTNSVSTTEFARAFYLDYQAASWPGSYWGHLVSWWEQRHHPQVLLLTYEGIKADLPAAVRTIAHFLGIEHDQALLDLVVKQASVDPMLIHQPKFSDPIMQTVAAKQGDVPPSAARVKVKQVKERDNRTELPAAIGAEMDAIWRETVEPGTGLASYRALQAALG